MAQERRSVIVTFKPKDQRPDADQDKLEIVAAATSSRVEFFEAGTLMPGAPPPADVPDEMIGFDINQFEAPIVTASLTDDEISALNENDNVALVEDDGPVYALDEEDYLQLEVEGQPSPLAETIPAGVNQIKAPLAWDGSRGKVIKVAVLDSGVAGTHPDLAPNYKGGVSFVSTEGTAEDFNSHGTHCAGTIAAAINGSGVVGVAPAAYLYGVKVLDRGGSGAWSQLIAGIDWCIQKGMKVLSMSLGGSAAPSALETMCNTAWSKGLLLVAAAGNSGPGMGTVNFPAKYGSVIAVSAVDSANAIANFSSRGPEVELCAPGVNVLSTVPGGGFGTKSGTSMACPHVSGVAALAWGGHRYDNNVTIRRLLAWRADNLGNPGRDPEFGFGRVDAEEAANEMVRPPAIAGIP